MSHPRPPLPSPLLSAPRTIPQVEPSARRNAQLSDVLRALSITLGLGELLQLLPPYVDSLVVCCPPVLRLVPWHLLLVEVRGMVVLALPPLIGPALTPAPPFLALTTPSPVPLIRCRCRRARERRACAPPPPPRTKTPSWAWTLKR